MPNAFKSYQIRSEIYVHIKVLLFSPNQHATPSLTMSGFFPHILLTEALKRPLKSRKKNGSECSCLRRDEQAWKNSSNSAEGLDKLRMRPISRHFLHSGGSITMVSTKWEALGQGGAKSQERPREATGCAKELQSVSWGCKGCKQASSRAFRCEK